MKDLVPDSISVEEWNRLSPSERRTRRQSLFNICPALRYQFNGPLNYEAQQAPLSYLLLVPLDKLLGWLSLPRRILLLRLASVIATSALLWWTSIRLGRSLNLDDGWAQAAVFCALLTQMLWASIAHICNDGLAVPLMVAFLGSLVEVLDAENKAPRKLIALSALLTAGLLTKAYFVAFLPVYIAVMVNKTILSRAGIRTLLMAMSIPAILAVPWYARNVFTYGSFSGTQESISGIGIAQAFAAVSKVNWIASAIEFARWSLWTGDWSFMSFSKPTLTIELALISCGVFLYFGKFRNWRAGEVWLLGACFCFALGLAYQTCVTWVSTRGASRYAEPWYGQGVLVCIWILAFKGLDGNSLWKRCVAAVLCMCSMWVALVTYLGKLPLFYGTGGNRSNLGAVVSFWTGAGGSDLATVMLGPAWLFYLALLAFVVLCGYLGAVIVVPLVTRRPSSLQG